AEKPVKQEKPAKAEAPSPEKEAETAAPAAQPDAANTVFEADSAEERAKAFLSDVTRLMGVDVSVNVRRDEEGNVRVDMFGDTLGILIGRRGETLDALQYLTSLYVNRGRDEYTRVTLDTENYRAKREESLRRLANRMANRAVKTGRKVVMEPMNPYERRILHSALQQNDAVTTHSEGEEPNRHVVITLKQQG
ncbi:MAG: RNA-binding cell elongation regulator Jag/EloR, partial [Eubacteriales bacterium]|nr:RNA-binding cell elongation regulator Jag/EloR [Eubacteriales bacterium]